MLRNLLADIESAPVSVASWLAGFAGILFIRYLLEAFSSPNMSGFIASDMPTLLHYSLFYLGAVLLTVVAVHAITRVPLVPMTRAFLFLLPLMWLAPLIDLVIGGGRMAYLFVSPAALLTDFLTYFGPLTTPGITLGMRIELALIMLVIAGYVFLRTRRVFLSIVCLIASYVGIFVAVSVPSLLVILSPAAAFSPISVWMTVLNHSLVSHSFLHPSELYTSARLFEMLFNAAMAQVWYLVLAVVGGAWLFMARPDIARAVLRNIRPERLAHFIIFAVLGGLLALMLGARVAWTGLDIVTLLVAFLTITSAWIFAVATNDLCDEDIDAVSNSERPLITGSLQGGDMRDVALVSGLMTLLGGCALGSYSLFFILVFSAAYYVYSVPPLRLKRVPLLSSCFIALASLASMLLGFFLLSPDKSLAAFPPSVGVLVLLSIALIVNVRDLKDLDGDKLAGIRTIPTLLGEKRSRMTLGAMLFIALLLVPIFIPLPVLWIPSLIAGAAFWIGLVRGRNERFVFGVYFIYLAVLVALFAYSGFS